MAMKCRGQEEGGSEALSRGVAPFDLPFDRIALNTYYIENRVKAGNGGGRETSRKPEL